MSGRPPVWDVTIKLDSWTERQTVRAETAAEAAWKVALDMADRGFGDRVEFQDVTRRPTP